MPIFLAPESSHCSHHSQNQYRWFTRHTCTKIFESNILFATSFNCDDTMRSGFFFHQYEEENHRDRLLTTFVRIIHFPTDVGMNEIGYCFRILPFSCSNGSNCSSSYTRECMHACVNTESSCILRRPCARRANRRGNGWDARERGTSVFSV